MLPSAKKERRSLDGWAKSAKKFIELIFMISTIKRSEISSYQQDSLASHL